MVASLRDSVLTWLDESLPGDIQLTWNLDGGGFTAEMQGELEKKLEIKQVIPAWRLTVESSLGPVYLQSSDGEENESDQSYISSESISEVVQVDIAEASAALYGLEQGKRFMLYTPQGPLQVQINKVFKDYSTGRAVLAIHKNTFQTYWPELLPGRLTLSLHNPNQASIVSIVDRLSESYKNDQLPVEVIPNGAIFKATLTIFDRTFAITTVLRMLAIIVACVGIFSAMLALQIQRQRDYAILRTAGMTSSGVARLLFLQAGIMGVFAGLIALPLGLVMCEVLIQVINKRAFGWSMESVLSGGVLVEAVLLALAASLLAGVLPARKVARVLPQVALRGQEEW
jgi:putative ABC transport system permease protein